MSDDAKDALTLAKAGCKSGRCGGGGFYRAGHLVIPILHVRNPEPGHCLECNKPFPAHELRNAYMGANKVWLGVCEGCKNNLTTPKA